MHETVVPHVGIVHIRVRHPLEMNYFEQKKKLEFFFKEKLQFFKEKKSKKNQMETTLYQRCQCALYAKDKEFFLSLARELFVGGEIYFCIRRILVFNHLLIEKALVTEHLIRSSIQTLRCDILMAVLEFDDYELSLSAIEGRTLLETLH